jgi:hypothetical protein
MARSSNSPPLELAPLVEIVLQIQLRTGEAAFTSFFHE